MYCNNCQKVVDGKFCSACGNLTVNDSPQVQDTSAQLRTVPPQFNGIENITNKEGGSQETINALKGTLFLVASIALLFVTIILFLYASFFYFFAGLFSAGCAIAAYNNFSTMPTKIVAGIFAAPGLIIWFLFLINLIVKIYSNDLSDLRSAFDFIHDFIAD